jgi:hypothetical protein
VRGVEHFVVLDTHASQLRDVEEATVAHPLTRGTPEGELVMLPLQYPHHGGRMVSATQRATVGANAAAGKRNPSFEVHHLASAGVDGDCAAADQCVELVPEDGQAQLRGLG